VIVDGVDAGTHYVDIGQRQDTDDLPVGGIVEIGAQPGEPLEADRTIDAIANGCTTKLMTMAEAAQAMNGRGGRGGL